VAWGFGFVRAEGRTPTTASVRTQCVTLPAISSSRSVRGPNAENAGLAGSPDRGGGRRGLDQPPSIAHCHKARVDLNLGQRSHTRTLMRPQSSRYTPRCPSVVLWTPCSGVEWRVFEPTIRGWRGDAQAACEPGGGGCGGVPVHPARLHTHRTSPAQTLLTILARHAEPNV
jgi:hypothetical protein